MPLTDDELFDFDHSRLEEFDLGAAKRRLAEQGETYRAQLVAARWIEDWLKRREEDELPTDSLETREGFDTALWEVAAHLRLGDLVPGGVLHDETDGRLQQPSADLPGESS